MVSTFAHQIPGCAGYFGDAVDKQSTESTRRATPIIFAGAGITVPAGLGHWSEHLTMS